LNEKIEFLAYLPPIQSAIKVSGEGDSMRIQFEIPVRTSPDAFRIALFTGKRLKITVEEVTDEVEDKANGNPDQRRRETFPYKKAQE
jgi:hypothetical protein